MMDATPSNLPHVQLVPAGPGRLMSSSEVRELLAFQRAVSEHVSRLHRAPGKAGRQAILAQIHEAPVREAVERIFSAQWRQRKGIA